MGIERKGEVGRQKHKVDENHLSHEKLLHSKETVQSYTSLHFQRISI